MAKIGKRISKARDGLDRDKLYDVADAVKLLKERATAKFDETIEVAMNLGVDPRHADQMVRGVVNLPNGTGRTVRVAVFARGDKAEEAKAAGADIVGAEDLVEKVQGGEIDIAISPQLATIGTLLAHVRRGDVVKVINTVGPTLPGTDGLGDWNIPWSQWKKGNTDT